MDVAKAIILMGQHIQVNTSDKNCFNNEDVSMNEASNTNKIFRGIPPSGLPKNKRPYKKTMVKSTNFPKDVKSLLETNIFNGIPVKYISWSRKNQLKGLIHGTGYICSCKDCDGYKVVKAKQFEEHAGCKTKHPNNHIYFPNGKSIHEVVQTLKETSQEQLCETIEEVMEGQVNHQNFRKWKAKYQNGEI